jgi:phage repressor protein C with HTH and peptisase S24 domain
MDGLEQDRRLLRALCEFTGLQPSRLAAEAGLAATTILRPFNGTSTSRLSAPTLEKLKLKFPTFPGWGELTAASRASSGSPAPQAKRDDLVDVRQIDLSFGLGAAYMDTEIIEDQAETMSFPVAWLKMITPSPPELLYWARGMGNSMEPTISDGDVILIDRSQIDVRFGDLYWAISYGQIGMIKRLRPMPDGGVKILSDNPAVTPETAYDGELHVFGRVVAVVKNL